MRFRYASIHQRALYTTLSVFCACFCKCAFFLSCFDPSVGSVHDFVCVCSMPCICPSVGSVRDFGYVCPRPCIVHSVDPYASLAVSVPFTFSQCSGVRETKLHITDTACRQPDGFMIAASYNGLHITNTACWQADGFMIAASYIASPVGFIGNAVSELKVLFSPPHSHTTAVHTSHHIRAFTSGLSFSFVEIMHFLTCPIYSP